MTTQPPANEVLPSRNRQDIGRQSWRKAHIVLAALESQTAFLIALLLRKVAPIQRQMQILLSLTLVLVVEAATLLQLDVKTNLTLAADDRQGATLPGATAEEAASHQLGRTDGMGRSTFQCAAPSGVRVGFQVKPGGTTDSHSFMPEEPTKLCSSWATSDRWFLLSGSLRQSESEFAEPLICYLSL